MAKDSDAKVYGMMGASILSGLVFWGILAAVLFGLAKACGG